MFFKRPTARAARNTSRRRLSVEPLEDRRVLDSTVVFSEIMYHPAAADGPEADLEWFELYNQMSVDMDISGWSVAGGVDFTFPTGTVIPGRGYLVVASNPSALETSSGYAAAFGPFTGRLSNSGEELRLQNRDGRLLSAVDYADDAPWPVGPDEYGFTLAKRDAYAASSEPASWTASAQLHGTPGSQNFPLPGEIETTTFVSIGDSTSYFVPTSGSLGLSWTSPAFDDSTWLAGPSGVGFDLANASPQSESGADAGSMAANNGDEGLENVDTVWTGAAGNGQWNSPSNWSLGVPAAGDRAFINGAATIVTVGPGVNAQAGRVLIADASNSTATLRVTGGNLTVSGDAQRLDVGSAGRGTLDIFSGSVHVLGRLYAGVDSNAANAQGTINIHGGSLVVDDRVLLGAGANLPLTHTLTMTGGSLTAAALYVGDGAHAQAEVSMLGGTMMLGDLAIPTNYGEPGLVGHFQLDGGTVYVTNPSVGGQQNLPGGFRLANGPPNPPLNPADVVQGTLDITGGVLVLAGDVRALVDSYIAAGVLTGFGQSEFVVYDYNVSHPGFTTVLARVPTVGEWVATDIAAQMHAINSTVYMRNEFSVPDASAVAGLLLHVAYNDGFVAYLNGQEVARRNAPASAVWNSAATAGVADVVEETIDVSAFSGALVSGGANVLAIHGLNSSVGDDAFVVAAELTASLSPAGDPVLHINEIAAATQSGFWIELSNTSDQPIALDGLQLESSSGALHVFAGQSIAPGGVLVVDQAQLGFGAAAGDAIFLLGPNKSRLFDARTVDTRVRGVDSSRDNQWLFADVATPGAPNSFANYSSVVINEIMYHAAPRQPTDSTPFQESDEEWIELYNRGPTAVDLTGWALRDAIDFDFPAGLTIPAGGYLVVSNNAVALAAAHPGITVVGDFSRSLSNSSDHIVLQSPDGNPADEVRYYDGGAWPGYADGGGSSLELRSPDADNSRPEAWAASDESDRGVWRNFTIRQTASADTGPLLWNEFLFGLLNDGDVLIDDVSVISDPDGAAVQLIQNGAFTGDALGAEPADWRIVGNHHGQVVPDPDNAANKVLRLTSVGVTGHESNNAGTTFVNNTPVVNGRVYEITFRARWLAGSNQLNARFYLDRVADTVYLTVPESTGTPGAQNSAYVANIGPTFRDFQHSPALPQPGEAVTVRVRADDPDGVAAATLYWAVDGGAWQTAAMTLGADGVYSAAIPGHAAGTVVQFYVAASDALGAVATYPGAGPNSRALYEVDDGAGPATAIDSVRIVMLTSDSDRFFDATNAMSNEFLGATVIYNNREVFYDVGVRPKGSSRSRLDSRYWGSYNVRFQPDHLFRGVHDQISLDSSGSSALVSFGQDEILVKQVINQAGGGLASAYDDLAYAVLPRSVQNGPVILQLARYDSVFLDESYVDGADGTVFEYELIYYPLQTADGTPEGLKLTEPTGVVGVDLKNLGDDPERYRWNFLIKNNRDADDYSAVINMAKTFSLSGSAFLAAIDDVIDVDQWLRTYAVANLNGIGDSYVTGGNRHNTQFYVRPSDGRVLLLPWDWDVAYVQSTTAGLVLNNDLNKMLASPAYRHAYYGHLLDIIDVSFNADYLTDWALEYGSLVGQNFNPHLNYVQSRAASVASQINAAAPQVAFAISTNGGNPFAVAAPTATLAGSGWVNVRELRVVGGQQPLDVAWNAVTGWQTTVPLAPGLNHVTIEAYDFQGQLIGSDTIDITSNFTEPQQRDALRITELMYHPPDPPPGLPLDADEFEFVEIQNTSAFPINLLGAKLEAAVQFTFPDITLGPGEFVVVVENAAAFASRYSGVIVVAGEYTGKLENSGELITLRDSDGQIIQSFTYGDDDWYPSTDGPGYSLVIVDVLADPATWGNASSWRPSTNRLGSPGQVDPLYLDADVNQDGAVDIFDVALVSSHWGETGPLGDANHDGAVDIFDVAAISQAWGTLPGGAAAASSAPAVAAALQGDPPAAEPTSIDAPSSAPSAATAVSAADNRRATAAAANVSAPSIAASRIALAFQGKGESSPQRRAAADAALTQLANAWRIRPTAGAKFASDAPSDVANEPASTLSAADSPRRQSRRSQHANDEAAVQTSPLDARAVDLLARRPNRRRIRPTDLQ